MLTIYADIEAPKEGGNFYHEGEFVFDLSSQSYEREPFSWGSSRGTASEHAATLVAMPLGMTVLDRAGAVEIFGEEAVAKLEAFAALQAAEDQREAA